VICRSLFVLLAFFFWSLGKKQQCFGLLHKNQPRETERKNSNVWRYCIHICFKIILYFKNYKLRTPRSYNILLLHLKVVASSNPAQARCAWYNIMWQRLSVTCDRSVVFSRYSSFLHQSNWPPQDSWNIVEGGVKYHKPNLIRPILRLMRIKKQNLALNY
jgi:hypothetical protein